MLTSGVAASCTNVIKIYWADTGEVHALKGIDAIFAPGAVTAIVGPSGSGKSSLLRILAGLDRPTAGSVMLGDTELNTVPQRRLHAVRRRLVGYVYQRPSDNLIPYLTVDAHLELAARRRRWRNGGVAELLDALGLGNRRRHLPSQLSGGEQQRVAFAQAVIGSPAIVLADEPTAELDSRSAGEVLNSVRRLADTGVAFVVSTHDPKVVAQADVTLLLRHGALESETVAERALSVVDPVGRIQLPPDALRLFPSRRALLEIKEDGVWISKP